MVTHIQSRLHWVALAIILLASFLASAAIIRYTVDVEGTAGTDWIMPAEPTEEVITIRGDGNSIFDDGEDPCPRIGCGSDKIIGSEGDDIIWGDDSLGGSSRTGRDWVLGGDGNDTIDGEAGNDRLYGEDGDDQIAGSEGNDRLEGSYGMDILDGGAGRDILFGGEDDDTLDGGSGNDVLHGDDGNDVIDGGSGNDTIEGSLGSDFLIGGGGNDTFIVQVGDAGDDVETIVCTEAHNETGKVVFKGTFLDLTPGRFRDIVITVHDTVGSYKILAGPGVCVLSRRK